MIRPDLASMRPITDFPWPVTYRWLVQTAYGATEQELSVDVPGLVGLPDETKALGKLLWGASVAAATTDDARLLIQDTIAWQLGPVPLAPSPMAVMGTLGAPAGPRGRQASFVLHSGHGDSWAKRAFFLPSIPRSWSDGETLNGTGLHHLEGLAQRMIMGIGGWLVGSPMAWLVRHTLPDGPDINGPRTTYFRNVAGIRVCHHVERAPEPSLHPWP